MISVRRLLLPLAAAAVLAAPAPAAADNIVVGDRLTFTDGVGNLPGGEIIATEVGDPTNVFATFCLERNEGLNLNGTTQYYVNDVSGGAIAGGIAGGNPDPIDGATALLYQAYREGSLDDASVGAGYTYNDATSADALQLAIWLLENEITALSDNVQGGPPANAPASLAAQTMAQLLLDWATAAGQAAARTTALTFVSVINVLEGGPDGPLRQSVLQYNSPVPEPGSMLLLGSGLLGLGAAARRRRAQRNRQA